MRNIIYQPWGGLGDNLAHSVIPELCHKNNIPCYLSNQNAYKHSSIYELVWKNNPYITGYVDNEDLSWLDSCFQNNNFSNHIEELQTIYGFEPITTYPKIYYNPKILKELNNKVIIDLSAFTLFKNYSADFLLKNIKNILDRQYIDRKNILLVTHTEVEYCESMSLFTECNTIDINDLFSYSDILASAKYFIGLYSGSSVLASTIKNHIQSNMEIFIFSFKEYLNRIYYNFDNTNYISVD